MKEVMIISGTYGYRDGNRLRPKSKGMNCVVNDKEADRLIKAGVARIVGDVPVRDVATYENGDDVSKPMENRGIDNKPLETPVNSSTEKPYETDFDEMTYNELRSYAKENGIEVSDRTKAGYLSAVKAFANGELELSVGDFL